jgi:hypothetical protein
MDWSRWLGFDVFVSYRQDDSSAYSEELVSILERHGLRCFLDRRETPAGALLDTEIKRCLARSHLLVVVLTPGLFLFHVDSPRKSRYFPPGPNRSCASTSKTL